MSPPKPSPGPLTRAVDALQPMDSLFFFKFRKAGSASTRGINSPGSAPVLFIELLYSSDACSPKNSRNVKFIIEHMF